MKPYKTVLTGLVILLLTFRGCSTLVNAQPIVVDCKAGRLAIAHLAPIPARSP